MVRLQNNVPDLFADAERRSHEYRTIAAALQSDALTFEEANKALRIAGVTRDDLRAVLVLCENLDRSEEDLVIDHARTFSESFMKAAEEGIPVRQAERELQNHRRPLSAY